MMPPKACAEVYFVRFNKYLLVPSPLKSIVKNFQGNVGLSTPPENGRNDCVSPKWETSMLIYCIISDVKKLQHHSWNSFGNYPAIVLDHWTDTTSLCLGPCCSDFIWVFHQQVWDNTAILKLIQTNYHPNTFDYACFAHMFKRAIIIALAHRESKQLIEVCCKPVSFVFSSRT